MAAISDTKTVRAAEMISAWPGVIHATGPVAADEWGLA